jgi:hypothetical protein
LLASKKFEHCPPELESLKAAGVVGKDSAFFIVKEVGLAAKVRLLAIQQQQIEAPLPSHHDVHPPVGVFPHDLLNGGRASSIRRRLSILCQNDPKLPLVLKAIGNHLLVALLKDV